jgi:transcriptional regulator MraZ
VARRFRGESVHKVDGKGRVSIPASYRRVLEACDPDWTEGLNPNLILVYGDKSRNFLEGFSIEAMEELDQQIDLMEEGSPERTYLEWLYSGQAMDIQVDETGRLVLPQKLRDKIGISTEAVFIASNKTFQIWQPEAYQAHKSRMEDLVPEATQNQNFNPRSLLGRRKEV